MLCNFMHSHAVSRGQLNHTMDGGHFYSTPLINVVCLCAYSVIVTVYHHVGTSSSQPASVSQYSASSSRTSPPLPPASPPRDPASLTPAPTCTHPTRRRHLGLDAEIFLVDKKPRVGHLAIVCIDEDNSRNVLYNKLIKPNGATYSNTRFRNKYFDSGVTWEELRRNGIPYDEAIDEVKELLRDAIVVGHNIKSDERALCFDIGSVAHCVYDTATNARLNSLVLTERDKPQSKLAGLAIGLLGREIQLHSPHDPTEDAFASLEIFLKYRDLFKEAPPPCSSRTAILLRTGQTFRLD